MIRITTKPPPSSASAERAEELFQQHRREIFRQTDKWFARLMVLQWLLGILLAAVVTPRTWAGEVSSVHIHLWAAIFLGGAISFFPIWMTRIWPGAAVTRHIIAVAQLLMSGLLIGLTNGRIETHFHVFGSLVILSFYRDWRVLIPATIVVGLDHFLRGVYAPYSVYGVLSASPWRFLEHGAWVLFEDIFLFISCLRSVREMRFIANRTAEQQQAKEEAERANRAKDNFLAALSHELRTPLTPVLMCAATLEDEPSLAPEHREQIGMIRRNVELEARLIDDLLDLTRISHGKLKLLVTGPVDVHALLKHTKEIVSSDAQDKRVHLEFEFSATEHNVAADAGRLHQVFWNLVKNAIKFTPVGGRITVRTTNPTPGRLAVTVRDNGIGIDRETLPIIFRPFEQGTTRSAEPSSGLGLGLSISKTIVELHGGTITAESAGRDLGALFSIGLDTVAPFPVRRLNDAKPEQSGAKLHRLLVVEDHEPTLTVLAGLLRRRGHQVLTATTVKDALSLAANHPIDFVISDLGLPDGNGVDLMLQLANEHGLRGIALSGYGMVDDLARTEQAGFLAHLVKPIKFDELHTVLEQFAPAAA